MLTFWGDQGAKAQQKRDRNAKDAKPKGSQLKVVRIINLESLPSLTSRRLTFLRPERRRQGHPVPDLQVHLPQDHQGSRVSRKLLDPFFITPTFLSEIQRIY